MVQDQGWHGHEKECRRWSGTVRALTAPAQAAQHPAEQSLHPANAKGDYLGYKMNKQKPSTRIYSIPLLPPAPSRHESGLGVRPAPQSGLQRAEPWLEGTVLDTSASTRGCWGCARSPVVQQDLQGACWPSAGKRVLRDGPFPWDMQVLHQDRQAAASCWDLVCAALHWFRVSC